MSRSRKTAAQKRQEFEDAKSRAWDVFFAKLQAVQTFEDALKLHAAAVSPSAPGRSFYSNFGFFMHYFAPPDGASSSELIEYRRLLGSFNAQGALKEGVLQPLEEALTKAIEDRRQRFR